MRIAQFCTTLPVVVALFSACHRSVSTVIQCVDPGPIGHSGFAWESTALEPHSLVLTVSALAHRGGAPANVSGDARLDGGAPRQFTVDSVLRFVDIAAGRHVIALRAITFGRVLDSFVVRPDSGVYAHVVFGNVNQMIDEACGMMRTAPSQPRRRPGTQNAAAVRARHLTPVAADAATEVL